MKELTLLTLSLTLLLVTSCSDKKGKLPNIVIIYADDMGYGDLACQNPDSKIPTPNLDRLASEGMRFTDAHSSSGICSPSRFALLTGTYHWRRQHAIVGPFGKPFFKDSDITLPQLLKSKGYTTACIGKWHLGWDWEFMNKPGAEVKQWGQMRKYYLPEDLDWNKPVGGGPLDRGFDYYFGDGTINFPPYAWMENDRLLQTPSETMDINNIPYSTKEGSWEFRPGPKAKDWNPYDVLPTLATKTVEWIGRRSENEPFFLYFALPSPHAPIIPNDEFDGTSRAGAYGDFMVQTDWVAGQVLKALKENGLEDNTIVIFSSDNGTEAYAWERAEKFGHFSMGNYRGLKRDVWEGGHHVPFIFKWPGHIKEGTTSDEVLSQIDIMATLASITGIELPENAAPDSYDFLPVLLGKTYQSPLREVIIHNTNENIWGIRKGDWLFINNHTGGSRELPESFKLLTGYTDFDTPGLLFNMKDDSEQRLNLYDKYPEKVTELEQLLQENRKPANSNQFDKTRWGIKDGKDYPYRDQMLNDLVYNDSVRMLDEQEILDLLGSPDRRTEGHFYYTVAQKRLGSWPLHTKSMVIKFANDNTIEWIKIHE
jgi:arylsulfatase A-like enzyme